jgi:lysophospholipase L1-like esterase
VFLTEDGVLPKEIMPDLLHPNEKGYELWAEALEPHLQKLLK